VEGFRIEEAPDKHNLYKYQQWMIRAREVTKVRLTHESHFFFIFFRAREVTKVRLRVSHSQKYSLQSRCIDIVHMHVSQ
jgi:hypothetical protein